MSDVFPEVFAALGLLKPYDIDVAKVKVGGERDGSYVLADIKSSSAVLSIGINGNDAFDLAMANRGRRVFMFDHTIEKAPHTHDRFSFHKLGLCGQSNRGPDLITLDEMIDNYCKGPLSILKIDIEGAEWEALLSVEQHVLTSVEQIVIEVHKLSNLADSLFRWRFFEIFSRLNKNFTLFHVHANNWGDIKLVEGLPVPDVLELSYVRTNLVARSRSTSIFPCWPSRANNGRRRDLPLLFYPFYPSALDDRDIYESVARMQQDVTS